MSTYYATATEEPMTDIFTVKVTNTDPLVELRPVGTDNITIDVINDFAWTASPRTNDRFSKVPVCYLTERKQTTNSLLASALYFLNAATAENITTDIERSGKFLQSKIDELVSDSGVLKGLTGNIGSGLSESISSLLDFRYVREALEQNDKELLKNRLKSYIGIYLTKPTGFRYALPFFNNTPLDIQNSWQSTTGMYDNTVGKVINEVLGSVEKVAGAFNITQPGTFIEKPKYYQYEDGGKTVTVSFPLLNTIKPTNKTPYQQNYEFLWILAFQNRPYRTSFSRISPPKIYTLQVPGQEYMPYCYISNMSIDFQGTRRTLPVFIPSPTGGSTPVNTTIPDAYIVSLTFTSLIANTGNTMVDTGFTSERIRASSVQSREELPLTLPIGGGGIIATSNITNP